MPDINATITYPEVDTAKTAEALITFDTPSDEDAGIYTFDGDIDPETYYNLREDFMEKISGVDIYGKGKCNIILSFGSADIDKNIRVQAGPVEFRKINIGNALIFDCRFQEKQTLRRVHDLLTSYARFTDVTSGTPDKDHQLFIAFTQNEEYWDGYLLAVNPVFFAATESVFGIGVDTMRMAFHMDTQVIYVDDPDDQALFPDGYIPEAVERA